MRPGPLCLQQAFSALHLGHARPVVDVQDITSDDQSGYALHACGLGFGNTPTLLTQVHVFHFEPATVHEFNEPVLRVDADRTSCVIKDCLFHGSRFGG